MGERRKTRRRRGNPRLIKTSCHVDISDRRLLLLSPIILVVAQPPLSCFPLSRPFIFSCIHLQRFLLIPSSKHLSLPCTIMHAPRKGPPRGLTAIRIDNIPLSGKCRIYAVVSRSDMDICYSQPPRSHRVVQYFDRSPLHPRPVMAVTDALRCL